MTAPLQSFHDIQARAEQRKGGKAGLQQWLPTLNSRQPKDFDDDRFLSCMTQCIFQAGFVYRVINQKWPQFEEAFWGFAPEKMVLLSPDHIDRLAKDARIVRNRQKILSVPANAQMILDTQKEYGRFADFIQQWPHDNLVELFTWLKKRGNRLGGMTGQRFLRHMGKDSFILTADVVQCLQLAGADIQDNPTSQRDLKAIQACFNEWQQQSGLSFVHISRIGACSVGKNYDLENT